MNKYISIGIAIIILFLGYFFVKDTFFKEKTISEEQFKQYVESVKRIDSLLTFAHKKAVEDNIILLNENFEQQKEIEQLKKSAVIRKANLKNKTPSETDKLALEYLNKRIGK